MIAEKLKTETKEAHQALEKLLIPRIKKTTTKQEYIQLLALFYGYYHPLEQKIEQYIDRRYLKDMQDRRKAGWLLSDMAYLGAAADGLPLSVHMPQITNAARAMGALYVMEGSALGGQIIKKMLQSGLAMEGNDGFYFFNGYGQDTGRLWSGFLSAANSFAGQEGHGQEMIDAANETFLSFKKFIEEQMYKGS